MNSVSLLPPNATSLMRAAAKAADRAFDLPLQVRDMWNPDTCPVDFLPWLAWAFSVDYWRAEWPESIKRNVIRTAVNAHRRNGTKTAVKEAIESLGARLELQEWFEYDGDPYTVRIEARANLVIDGGAGDLLGPELERDLQEIFARHAPARVHFDLILGADFTAGKTYGSALTTPVNYQDAALAGQNPDRTMNGVGGYRVAAITTRPIVWVDATGTVQ